MNIENKLKILVIEDKDKNIASARALLKNHDLEIATSFEEATSFLGYDHYGKIVDSTRKYDVLLTDMFFSQGGEGNVLRDQSMKKEIHPFGYPVAILAAKQGVPLIGIVSHADHHANPMSHVYVDFFEGALINSDIPPFKINDSLVVCRGDWTLAFNDGTFDNTDRWPKNKEQGRDYDRVKDWARTLESLLQYQRKE